MQPLSHRPSLRISRCFKCTSARTDKCPVITPPEGHGHGGSLDDLLSPGEAPTASLLVKHLHAESSELAVADAFRVYAPVVAVLVFLDPMRPASRSPHALVTFADAATAEHVLTNTTGRNELKIHGFLARPAFAKPTAHLIVAAWAARTAAAAAAADAAAANGSARGAGGGGSGFEVAQQVMQSRGVLNRQSTSQPLLPANARVVAPFWPPSFDDDGAAWVFDPASSYFLHRQTGMFYEPKAKWYCKADPGGGYSYYHFAGKGRNPPFVPMPVAAQQAPASSSALAATAPVPVPVVAASHAVTSVASGTGIASKKRHEASGASLSLVVKKNLKDMGKWRDRLQREAFAEEPQAPGQTSAAAGAVAAGAAGTGAVAGESTVSGPGSAPLLLTLGSDYGTVRRLGLVGEAGVGPLVEGGGSRWACLVSRRCFETEAQLAKHIAVSNLYKAELAKAVAEGRVVLSP